MISWSSTSLFLPLDLLLELKTETFAYFSTSSGSSWLLPSSDLSFDIVVYIFSLNWNVLFIPRRLWISSISSVCLTYCVRDEKVFLRRRVPFRVSGTIRFSLVAPTWPAFSYTRTSARAAAGLLGTSSSWRLMRRTLFKGRRAFTWDSSPDRVALLCIFSCSCTVITRSLWIVN